MKKGTSRHPKMKRLARELSISRHEATGIMVDLWEWAGDYATDGAIGRHDNYAIADGVEYQGDADSLVEALVKSGWVDRCADHRLCIHDWASGCDQWVKRKLERSNQVFSHQPISSSNHRPDNGGQRPPCGGREGEGKERDGEDQAEGGPGETESASLVLLRRIGGRSAHVPTVAAVLDQPSAVVALWRDVTSDPSVKRPIGVMASRLTQGTTLPACDAKAIIAARDAGIVHRINGIDVTNGVKLGWNSGGLTVDGKLAIATKDMNTADLA